MNDSVVNCICVLNIITENRYCFWTVNTVIEEVGKIDRQGWSGDSWKRARSKLFSKKSIQGQFEYPVLHPIKIMFGLQNYSSHVCTYQSKLKQRINLLLFCFVQLCKLYNPGAIRTGGSL